MQDLKTKTILVVEDEAKILEVIKAYLCAAGYRVIAADSGKAALENFVQHKIDLVVLDLMLPDINGEEICKNLRKQSRVPIIILTAKIEEADIIQGLAIGADDYLTKPFSPRQLVARIETILRRVTNEPIPLAREYAFNQNDLKIDCLQHRVFKKGKDIALTPIEFRLLLVFLKYPRKVFTREELIQIAMNDDFAGNDRTIDTHIKNLRQKIEDDLRSPRYILTVYGLGYRFGGEDIDN